MQVGLGFLGSVLLAASLAGAASAKPIFLWDDRRSVSYAGQDCDYDNSCGEFYNVTETPAAFGADFGDSSGLQVTTIDYFLMEGEGFGDAYSDVGWYASESIFDVDFRVTDPTEVHLYGTLDAIDAAFGAPAAGVRFSQGATKRFEQLYDPWTDPANKTFDETQILAPGIYTLEVWAYGGGGGNGSAYFDFTLDVSPGVASLPIPEPGSAGTLALGLAALGHARRRARRR